MEKTRNLDFTWRCSVPEKVGTEVLKSHNNKTNLKLLLLISLMLVTITTAITTMTMTMKIPWESTVAKSGKRTIWKLIRNCSPAIVLLRAFTQKFVNALGRSDLIHCKCWLFVVGQSSAAFVWLPRFWIKQSCFVQIMNGSNIEMMIFLVVLNGYDLTLKIWRWKPKKLCFFFSAL